MSPSASSCSRSSGTAKESRTHSPFARSGSGNEILRGGARRSRRSWARRLKCQIRRIPIAAKATRTVAIRLLTAVFSLGRASGRSARIWPSRVRFGSPSASPSPFSTRGSGSFMGAAPRPGGIDARFGLEDLAQLLRQVAEPMVYLGHVVAEPEDHLHAGEVDAQIALEAR